VLPTARRISVHFQPAWFWRHRRYVSNRLCTIAWSTTTVRTFARPRTRTWYSPRFRIPALTHSAVSPRWRYCACAGGRPHPTSKRRHRGAVAALRFVRILPRSQLLLRLLNRRIHLHVLRRRCVDSRFAVITPSTNTRSGTRWYSCSSCRASAATNRHRCPGWSRRGPGSFSSRRRYSIARYTPVVSPHSAIFILRHSGSVVEPRPAVAFRSFFFRCSASDGCSRSRCARWASCSCATWRAACKRS